MIMVILRQRQIMDIILQSIGFTASDKLREFVNEKLDKFGHHLHNVIRADVTLTKGPEAEQRNNYCEMRLEVSGYDHFAKKNSTTFEHAITETVDALEHMVEKAKEKDMSKRHA